MKTILGFTESINDCGCCGKSGLKGTYAIEIDGALTYFGSSCAFKNNYMTKEGKKTADRQFKSDKAFMWIHGGSNMEEALANQKRSREETIRVWNKILESENQ